MSDFQFGFSAVRAFYNSSQNIQPVNDNMEDGRKGYCRFVFTDEEVNSLNSLYGPFIQSGQLAKPVYKKGEDTSCIILDSQKDRRVVLAIVKQSLPETFAHYSINFGKGYDPQATINFSEILRMCRVHLRRSFTLPERTLSLVR